MAAKKGKKRQALDQAAPRANGKRAGREGAASEDAPEPGRALPPRPRRRKSRSPRPERERLRMRGTSEGEVDEAIRFDDLAPRVLRIAGLIGAGGLLSSIALGAAKQDGWGRFMHSYLVAFMFVLSIGLGALFWVTLQHLVNAQWSVAVRRIGELLAMSLPLLAILSLPVVVPALLGNAELFPWADAEYLRTSHALEHKRPYLNLGFFGVRCLVYFGFWSLLGWWWISRSRAHDATGDDRILAKMRSVSAPAMIGFGLTTTFAAIDFLMTLDPEWFSTIFGVYYFAGCVIAVHATMALLLRFLQSHGRLVRHVTVHHYHDLGKMLFAFTVFWAYIAFSQFMLIWYANIPEETRWYRDRTENGWLSVGVLLIVAHFLLPFFGLLSRHVKRHAFGITFWSVWLLSVHYLDLYWLVMPAYGDGALRPDLLDLTTLAGLSSLMIAYTAWLVRGVDLIPVRDPRLAGSLGFQNL